MAGIQTTSEAGLLLAETYLQLNRPDDAQAVLDQFPLQDKDRRYQGLLVQIELLRQAADTPEIQQLQQQVRATCAARCRTGGTASPSAPSGGP